MVRNLRRHSERPSCLLPCHGCPLRRGNPLWLPVWWHEDETAGNRKGLPLRKTDWMIFHLYHPVPAPNKEKLTGQPVSLFRGEKYHHIGHIFRLSHTPKGNLHVQPLLQFGRNVSRLDWPWRDNI